MPSTLEEDLCVSTVGGRDADTASQVSYMNASVASTLSIDLPLANTPLPLVMQSLLEYEAVARCFQSLAEVEDEGVEGTTFPSELFTQSCLRFAALLITLFMILFIDTDVSSAPPSYTEEAAGTPWVSREILPPDSEAAFGIALDSIPEDDTPPGSPLLVVSSPAPLADAETLPEAPVDYCLESSTFSDSGA